MSCICCCMDCSMSIKWSVAMPAASWALTSGIACNTCGALGGTPLCSANSSSGCLLSFSCWNSAGVAAWTTAGTASLNATELIVRGTSWSGEVFVLPSVPLLLPSSLRSSLWYASANKNTKRYNLPWVCVVSPHPPKNAMIQLFVTKVSEVH